MSHLDDFQQSEEAEDAFGRWLDEIASSDPLLRPLRQYWETTDDHDTAYQQWLADEIEYARERWAR